MMRSHASESKRSKPLGYDVVPAINGRAFDEQWNTQTLGRWRG